MNQRSINRLYVLEHLLKLYMYIYNKLMLISSIFTMAICRVLMCRNFFFLLLPQLAIHNKQYVELKHRRQAGNG